MKQASMKMKSESIRVEFIGPRGLKPVAFNTLLRGAEAPLFHGAAWRSIQLSSIQLGSIQLGSIQLSAIQLKGLSGLKPAFFLTLCGAAEAAP
jgi:hypothetical protein